MKRLFSLICVAMFAVVASAQITWNVKGGAGIATCYGGEMGDLSKKPHFVGKLGFGIEYPLSSNLSLMPSLEFAIKGVKWELQESTWNYDTTVDLYYLQVPVVAAYRLNLTDALNMTLKAGPYFAYAVSDHYSDSGTNASNGSSYSDSGSVDAKKFDVGIDAGIDFEFHRFVLGLEAEVGFTTIAKGVGDVKNLAFYATIGYKF